MTRRHNVCKTFSDGADTEGKTPQHDDTTTRRHSDTASVNLSEMELTRKSWLDDTMTGQHNSYKIFCDGADTQVMAGRHDDTTTQYV